MKKWRFRFKNFKVIITFLTTLFKITLLMRHLKLLQLLEHFSQKYFIFETFDYSNTFGTSCIYTFYNFFINIKFNIKNMYQKLCCPKKMLTFILL